MMGHEIVLRTSYDVQYNLLQQSNWSEHTASPLHQFFTSTGLSRENNSSSKLEMMQKLLFPYKMAGKEYTTGMLALLYLSLRLLCIHRQERGVALPHPYPCYYR